MNIQPLWDRVLLKWVEPEATTKSGIFIPETTKERPQMYTVIAVWPGKETDGKMQKIDLVAGDTVLSGQYSGDEIKIDGEQYKIVAFEYILAKVSK